ncbi:MAG: GxxExxY protein [Verrucomicrobiota bacterium]
MRKRRRRRNGMNSQRAVFELCDRIRETSLPLHRYLRHGHLEKVYENGLAHRLRKVGLLVQQQHPLEVCDEDGATLGSYFADLFVSDFLIVEVKACRRLAEEHVAQLLGYLRACRVEHGLLINFGSRKLEIRKYILSDSPSCDSCLPCEALAKRGASLRPSADNQENSS